MLIPSSVPRMAQDDLSMVCLRLECDQSYQIAWPFTSLRPHVPQLAGELPSCDSPGAEGWNGLAGQAEAIPKAKGKSVEGRLLVRSQEFFLR